MNSSDQPILFFDGVCNFCNYWVQFIIHRDPKKKFLFAAMQGETAKKMLPQFGIKTTSLSSVILIEHGKVYTQSSASLRITRYLTGGWKLLYGLMIFPKFLRDAVYNIIARYRYRWFGKKEECMIPPPNWQDRFLP